MDARRAGDLAAYAPRGTRANDIQALWYGQLLAGADFAELLGDHAAAERWRRAAGRVQHGFAQLFIAPGTAAAASVDCGSRHRAGRRRPHLAAQCAVRAGHGARHRCGDDHRPRLANSGVPVGRNDAGSGGSRFPSLPPRTGLLAQGCGVPQWRGLALARRHRHRSHGRVRAGRAGVAVVPHTQSPGAGTRRGRRPAGEPRRLSTSGRIAAAPDRHLPAGVVEHRAPASVVPGFPRRPAGARRGAHHACTAPADGCRRRRLRGQGWQRLAARRLPTARDRPQVPLAVARARCDGHGRPAGAGAAIVRDALRRSVGRRRVRRRHPCRTAFGRRQACGNRCSSSRRSSAGPSRTPGTGSSPGSASRRRVPSTSWPFAAPSPRPGNTLARGRAQSSASARHASHPMSRPGNATARNGQSCAIQSFTTEYRRCSRPVASSLCRAHRYTSASKPRLRVG